MTPNVSLDLDNLILFLFVLFQILILLQLLPSLMPSKMCLNLDYFFFFICNLLSGLIASNVCLNLYYFLFFISNLLPCLVASKGRLNLNYLLLLAFLFDSFFEFYCIFHFLEGLCVSLALELFVSVWLNRLRTHILLNTFSIV